MRRTEGLAVESQRHHAVHLAGETQHGHLGTGNGSGLETLGNHDAQSFVPVARVLFGPATVRVGHRECERTAGARQAVGIEQYCLDALGANVDAEDEVRTPRVLSCAERSGSVTGTATVLDDAPPVLGSWRDRRTVAADRSPCAQRKSSDDFGQPVSRLFRRVGLCHGSFNVSAR